MIQTCAKMYKKADIMTKKILKKYMVEDDI